MDIQIKSIRLIKNPRNPVRYFLLLFILLIFMHMTYTF